MNVNKEEVDALIAKNLALSAALDEAITEYQDTIEYKDDYLVEKHKDRETIAELRQVLLEISNDGCEMLKHLQADAIDNLKFPVELRKMWSGGDVQEWLKEQACLKRKK